MNQIKKELEMFEEMLALKKNMPTQLNTIETIHSALQDNSKALLRAINLGHGGSVTLLQIQRYALKTTLIELFERKVA